MKKSRKKLLAGVMVFGMMMPGFGYGAATYYGYDATVPVLNDYETGGKKKTTTGSAYNKVEYIQKSRGLVSWVETSGGSNITNRKSYSSTGKKTMDYESASTRVGKSLHLNISTAPSNFNSTSTNGTWTPN